jgi:hypothetical protein
MMTDDDFEESLLNLKLACLDEMTLDESSSSGVELARHVLTDLRTATDEETRELCKGRRRRVHAVLIEQALFVAQLRGERIREGEKQSEGN